jgi:hypothetical protein
MEIQFLVGAIDVFLNGKNGVQSMPPKMRNPWHICQHAKERHEKRKLRINFYHSFSQRPFANRCTKVLLNHIGGFYATGRYRICRCCLGRMGHVEASVSCVAAHKSSTGGVNKTFVQHRQPAIFLLSRIGA